MMSIDARRSLAWAASVRYAKATKKEKGAILDEFCANTALSRKHALRMLLQPPEPRATRLKRKRAKVYDEPEQLALRRLWPLLNYPSARRTVAGLADLIEACERHDEWVPDGALRERLLAMSASTCDRLLQPLRRVRPKGHSLTRAGKYLRSQIAVRIGTDWDDAVPDFAEGDLVAHCGASAQGSFHFTLTLTDVCLGWTELVALSSKGQIQALAGLELASRRMPVLLKGLDFDNGSEFMNHHMQAFCRKHEIALTRGRPYVKNDGCRVEQKNGAIVRRHVGYGRLDTSEQLCTLKELYGVLRLLVNFFEPSSKLTRIRTEQGKTRKIYDPPKTPYRRALESDLVPQQVKDELEATFLALNPVRLRNRLRLIKQDLLEPELVRLLDDATDAFGCDS